MARSIYGLFYLDEGYHAAKRYFYVGRSVDVFRRLKQHNYAKDSGHEDKYEFIRELEAKGIGWNIEVLRVIPDGEYPPDNERWFVIKLTRDGHQLMNMRYGSKEYLKELSEQINSHHIRSISDVGLDRTRRKYIASKRVKRRILNATLKRDGIKDVKSDELLPRVLHRKLVAQNCKSIEAGLTLGEVFRLTRAERIFRRIEAKINT